jgi:DnaJ-class molecular chaperone
VPPDYADPTGFSDFFETLFGRGNRRTSTDTGSRPNATRRPETPVAQPGENIEQPIEISLRDAYSGTTRSFTVEVTEPCPVCQGTGFVGTRVCATCGGVGTTSRTRKLEVQIPPGVDTGSKVRVKGAGQPGVGGGPAGDLFLLVTMAPDPTFERKGDDLVTDVQVPLSIAVLGGEARVDTLDGKRVMLTIPPETQNGQTFRLAGKGMPKRRDGGFGNLLVRVQVVLPQRLSPQEKQLFEQLAQLRPTG